MVDWISWARRDIEGVLRLINLTWARRLDAVPMEIGWDLDASVN